MSIKEILEKHDDEFLKFEHVQNKLSNRPDLHAFLLLDKLVPGDRDMVVAAEHDQIWLAVDPTELENAATEEQIVDLYRCGMIYDEDIDSLSMFV